MGVDPALGGDSPAVFINGEKYYYGKEPEYGQFMVSHHSYGKWYWCFDTRQELIDFLENLPESANRPTINGQQIVMFYGMMPQDEYRQIFEEHRSYLRFLLETRRRHGLTYRYGDPPDE
jgi:hypothetical protein